MPLINGKRKPTPVEQVATAIGGIAAIGFLATPFVLYIMEKKFRKR